MLEVIKDALFDSLTMIPLLFVIYLALELIEWRAEKNIKRIITASRSLGPLLGALFGCIPQCGFSTIAAALYVQRFISLGTLLAVFLSTSDEAIPVILAQPDKIGVILPILAIKFLIGLVAGYGIDLLFKTPDLHTHTSISDCACETAALDSHCCGKEHATHRPLWQSLVLIPLRHTAEVFIFILAVSTVINLIIWKVGEGNLGNIFMAHTIFQPMVAVLIGLIPNCAASVAITQIFLKGGITFGSAIAGLAASAGLGLLVLVKENKDTADTFKVIGLLAAVSLIAGLILNSFSL